MYISVRFRSPDLCLGYTSSNMYVSHMLFFCAPQVTNTRSSMFSYSPTYILDLLVSAEMMLTPSRKIIMFFLLWKSTEGASAMQGKQTFGLLSFKVKTL